MRPILYITIAAATLIAIGNSNTQEQVTAAPPALQSAANPNAAELNALASRIKTLEAKLAAVKSCSCEVASEPTPAQGYIPKPKQTEPQEQSVLRTWSWGEKPAGMAGVQYVHEGKLWYKHEAMLPTQVFSGGCANGQCGTVRGKWRW